jgi:hypothetical protein
MLLLSVVSSEVSRPVVWMDFPGDIYFFKSKLLSIISYVYESEDILQVPEPLAK